MWCHTCLLHESHAWNGHACSLHDHAWNTHSVRRVANTQTITYGTLTNDAILTHEIILDKAYYIVLTHTAPGF